MRSAVLRPVSRLNALRSIQTGTSSHWPLSLFFLRLFTAKPTLATLPPFPNVLISGSRVRRPISMTLFRFATGDSVRGGLSVKNRVAENSARRTSLGRGLEVLARAQVHEV